MFPKVPQSSQTESLRFPSYPLPLDPPLKNPIKKSPTGLSLASLVGFPMVFFSFQTKWSEYSDQTQV